MEGFRNTCLTPGGTPALLPAERTTLTTTATVSIYSTRADEGRGNTPYSVGALFLTTHRLVWTSHPVAVALPLATLRPATLLDGSSIRTARLLIRTHAHGEVRFVFGRRREREAVAAALATALRERPWAAAAAAAAAATARKETALRDEVAAAGATVGVAGLLAHERARTAARGATIEGAFQDLDALMDKAGELVELAARFKAAGLAAGRAEGGAPAGGAAGGDTGAGGSDVWDMMDDLGIASPVTKATTTGGRRGRSKEKQYHIALARQLVDFLMGAAAGPAAAAADGAAGCAPGSSSGGSSVGGPGASPSGASAAVGPLARAGGVLTLADVYCLYNRARRSADLVTPDDLAAAVAQLAPLRLPLRVVTLPGGVTALEAGALRGTTAAAARLRERAAAAAGGSLGVLDVAAVPGGGEGLPPAVAREMLEAAEASGALCRDVGGWGEVRWYPNRFSEPGWGEGGVGGGGMGARGGGKGLSAR